MEVKFTDEQLAMLQDEPHWRKRVEARFDEIEMMVRQQSDYLKRLDQLLGMQLENRDKRRLSDLQTQSERDLHHKNRIDGLKAALQYGLESLEVIKQWATGMDKKIAELIGKSKDEEIERLRNELEIAKAAAS